MKSKKIMVTSRSTNAIKELRNYKYHEDKSGRVTNVPVDKFNHFIDATRYAMTWKMLKANHGRYVIG
jgi:phage terminase large subunit